MTTLIIISTLFLLLSITYISLYKHNKKFNQTGSIQISDTYYIISCFLIITVFILKIIYSSKSYFYGDMYSFHEWMHSINNEGLAGYYSKYGVSYPPFHIFIIYIIGKINSLLNLTDFSILSIVLFKFPAILFDFLSCLLLLKIGRNHLNDLPLFLVILLFSTNPAIIINSTQWGQVDSIYTFFIAYMCYYISEKKMCKAYYSFAIAILFKYQAIIFTPILIYGIIENVFLINFQFKNMFKNILQGLSAVFLMLLSHIPFIFGNNAALYNIKSIIKQYTGSLTAYPFASWNAYNIWELFGLNLVSQENKFLNITYKTWGTISIILLVVFSAILWLKFTQKLKNKSANNIYFLISGFIISTMFMFSVRMHERYLYPVILLLFIFYALSNNIRIFISAILFSIMQYWNVGHIFYNLNSSTNSMISEVFPRLISLFTLLTWGYFVFSIFKLLKNSPCIIKK